MAEQWQPAELEAHRPVVERYLGRMLRVDEVEDATQTVMERALAHRDKFRGDSSLRSWILGIARNVGLEAARSRQKKQRRQVHANDPFGVATTDLLPADEPSPEAQLGRKQEHAIALSALQDMNLDDQLVLLVTYVDQLPGQEAARLLDLSFDAFRQRLSRARKNLRKKLEGQTDGSMADGAEVLAAWEALLRPDRESP